MRKKILTALLVYLLVTLLTIAILAWIGYDAAGKDGAISAANLGFILSLIALPFLGIFISANYWSGLVGRWGEYNYKKELEGDPHERSKQDRD